MTDQWHDDGPSVGATVGATIGPTRRGFLRADMRGAEQGGAVTEHGGQRTTPPSEFSISPISSIAFSIGAS